MPMSRSPRWSRMSTPGARTRSSSTTPVRKWGRGYRFSRVERILRRPPPPSPLRRPIPVPIRTLTPGRGPDRERTLILMRNRLLPSRKIPIRSQKIPVRLPPPPERADLLPVCNLAGAVSCERRGRHPPRWKRSLIFSSFSPPSAGWFGGRFRFLLDSAKR